MKKFYTLICLMLFLPVLAVGASSTLKGGIPRIGLENFQSGQYPGEFHSRMAESFPWRDSLLEWNRQLNGLYTFTGFSSDEEVQILVPIVNDGADHGASVPELTLPPTEPTVLPEREEATEEVTHREEAPTESVTESVYEEEELSVETFGQILLMGDRALELPVANYDAILQYSQSVSAIAAELEGVNVYSILVPNSAGLYAPQEYRQGEDSQENMIDYAYYTMNDAVSKVDAYSILRQHKDEYLYFRTDHHWTHLGSYYAYTAFCEKAGLSPVPLEEFTTGEYETFLGTMYSFLSGYSQREILRENPDSLTYYIPQGEVRVRYYDSAALYYGGEIDLFYPLSESYSNKYICFLGGDHPITVIETEQTEERVCLVLKESYGNAFASWLTNHYSKIICVDPREFNRNDKPSLDLQEFAQRMGVDDCIILNYPLMINSSAYGAWLGRLVK